MGFIFDSKISEYVPNTVIQEDIRDLVSNQVRVIAVYRKDINADYYDEITYIARGIDLTSIKYPEKLQKLIC